MIPTLLCAIACAGPGEKGPVSLPSPDTRGALTLESTLQVLRSVRSFDTARPLTLQQVSQLLWAAQGLMLQALTLGLGTTAVGAFDDGAMRKVFALPPSETPLYLIPVGHPAGR
ncbi:MAG: nitroreductase family protein [Acidobacteria bacterium]|nr:nitroreductase family protein [Acidobacteriota bacterium]